MNKKFLVFIVMLAVFTFLWSAEDGTTISRDNSAGLTRFQVTNSNVDAGSQAGFIAENDDGEELLIFIEAAADGSDVHIRSSAGSMYSNLPTGKIYYWNINDGEVATLGASGFTGTWVGVDVGVEYGGTGASALDDGFVLLGSGTGAITPIDLTTNGCVLVGDGATDPVAYKILTASDGYLDRAVGGLGVGVHAWTSGLYGMVASVTTNIDTKAELEVAIGQSSGDLALAIGETFTGDNHWYNAFIMTNQAAPNGIPEKVALQFEGETDDGVQTYFLITDPTTLDKTITFQDHDGIVAMDDKICHDLEGTNLSITDGVLNAVTFSHLAVGDSLYFWCTGATKDNTTNNWRLGLGATDIVWAYCSNGAANTWVTKETKLP